MRKALIGIQVLLILSLTGCLKDERYEDQEMGITITDIPAVAFPQASSSPINYAITGQAAGIQVDGPLLTLETTGFATSDVHITLVYDQAAVTAAGLKPLPAGTFTLSSLSPVIPSGAKSVGGLKLTVTNTDVLDPNFKYGVGIKISTADQGFKVAANMNTVIVAFSIKNKWDGKYHLVFKNYHPSSNPGYTGGTAEVEMHTTGPNTVKIYWPDEGGYYNPAILGGSLTAFGAQEPEYTINTTTNAVTVQNAYVGATTFYAMATGYNSRYEPATKKIFAKWGYGSGGPYPPFSASTSREWEQEFTFIGPR